MTKGKVIDIGPLVRLAKKHGWKTPPSLQFHKNAEDCCALTGFDLHEIEQYSEDELKSLAECRFKVANLDLEANTKDP